MELLPRITPAQLPQVLADPATFTALLDHVAEGGTLISYCAQRGLPYGPTMRWVYGDATRQEALNGAVLARGQWLIQRVLGELQALGFTDIRGLLDANGRLLPPAQWPDAVARAVSSIEIETRWEGQGEDKERVDVAKVKVVDKVRALELIGKTLAMFVERHQIVGRLQLEDLVAASQPPPVPPPETPRAP